MTATLAVTLECDGPPGRDFCPDGAVYDTGEPLFTDARDKAERRGWRQLAHSDAEDICPRCVEQSRKDGVHV